MRFVILLVGLLGLLEACTNDPKAAGAANTPPMTADDSIELAKIEALRTDSLRGKLEGEAFEKLLISNKNMALIDLRKPEAFANGHIHRAINWPFDTTTEGMRRYLSLDQLQPLALYCDNGYLSQEMASRLRATGYPSVYILRQGLISWYLADKTVFK
jgi:rhodanese-related sulfurtransferase